MIDVIKPRHGFTEGDDAALLLPRAAARLGHRLDDVAHGGIAEFECDFSGNRSVEGEDEAVPAIQRLERDGEGCFLQAKKSHPRIERDIGWHRTH